MSKFVLGATETCFTSLKGTIRKAAKSLRDITRTSVNGHEYLDIGKRGPIFELRGTADVVRDGNEPKARIEAYENDWKGNVVTILDDAIDTHHRMMILDVQARFHYSPLIVGGANASGYIISSLWTLQHVGAAD